MKSYVDFQLVEHKSKTNIYQVVSKNSTPLPLSGVIPRYEKILGIIKWYGPWRQYVLFPSDCTLWSHGCLQEVMSFIKGLMDARKKCS